MDIFKAQLHIVTDIFYKMSVADQVNAFKILKEIIQDLQVALSQLHKEIYLADELKIDNQDHQCDSMLDFSASEENKAADWKGSVGSRRNSSEILVNNENHSQDCFDLSLPEEACCILNQETESVPLIQHIQTGTYSCTEDKSHVMLNSIKENEPKISSLQSSSEFHENFIEECNDSQNFQCNQITGGDVEIDSIDSILDANLEQQEMQLESDLVLDNENPHLESRCQEKSVYHEEIPNTEKSLFRANDSNTKNNMELSDTNVDETTYPCDNDSAINSKCEKLDTLHSSHREKNRNGYLVPTRSSQRLANRKESSIRPNLNIKSKNKILNKSVSSKIARNNLNRGRNTKARTPLEKSISNHTMTSNSPEQAVPNSDKQIRSKKVLKTLAGSDSGGDFKKHNIDENSCGMQTEKHAVFNAVSCRRCKTKFTTYEDFCVHCCKKNSSKLYCEKCDLTFIHPQHFQKHMNGHTRNSCKICNAQFAKRKALCKHLRTIHNIIEAEKLYECTYCGRKFIKRPSLYVHLKEHAGNKIVCMKCGIMCESKETYIHHMLKHSEEAKYHCMKCKENFQRRQQYEQHMTGHQKYDCSNCNISFSTKKHLMKHRRLIHSIQIQEEKKHECNICYKKFQRPMLLEIHRRLHTGEKPIQCIRCDKNFRTPKALAKHMKTVSHKKASGQADVYPCHLERSFLCAECGAKFFRKQGLIRHMQQLHSEERPYICPHCDYTCKCKTNLKRHIELHTDERRFICEVCGASFHARATLKEHHAYVHSEARNFVCSDCGKAFKGRSGLRRHSRIHSDARPYVCYCGQAYKRMSHLKRHMISMHGATFKSKRIVRLFDENSQSSTNTVTFRSEEMDDGNSNDLPSLTLTNNVVNEMHISSRHKNQEDHEDNMPIALSDNMSEMLQQASEEQLRAANTASAIISDAASYQHFLSLTSTQEANISTTLSDSVGNDSSSENTSTFHFSMVSSNPLLPDQLTNFPNLSNGDPLETSISLNTGEFSRNKSLLSSGQLGFSSAIPDSLSLQTCNGLYSLPQGNPTNLASSEISNLFSTHREAKANDT